MTRYLNLLCQETHSFRGERSLETTPVVLESKRKKPPQKLILEVYAAKVIMETRDEVLSPVKWCLNYFDVPLSLSLRGVWNRVLFVFSCCLISSLCFSPATVHLFVAGNPSRAVVPTRSFCMWCRIQRKLNAKTYLGNVRFVVAFFSPQSLD